MPLTEKGKKILGAMRESYSTEKEAEKVFYASANKGTITGVHDKMLPEHRSVVVRRAAKVNGKLDAVKGYLDSARRGDASELDRFSKQMVSKRK